MRSRYSAAAEQREVALCCPVTYREELLEAVPKEIIERDYGCGDPSPFVKRGDTVLDLGSGGGKLCYIAAQLVGVRVPERSVPIRTLVIHPAGNHRPNPLCFHLLL